MSKDEIELLLIPTEEELKHEEEMILFAEFLGYEKGDWYCDAQHCNSSDESYWTREEVPNSYKIDNDGVYPHEMQFKTSWNWLMEVVEEIETIHLPKYRNYTAHVTIEKGLSTVTWGANTLGTEGTFISSKGDKLERTYEVCLKFIKWYNSAMEKK